MPPARIKKNIAKPAPKVREGMDKAHLEKIRQCPCCACGQDMHFAAAGGTIGQSQAHHLLRTEERGLSRKSSDRWAIPLCFYCHDPRVQDSLHHDGGEEAWLMKRGIDGRALASALWAVRHKNLDHYRTVVFAHRQRAALKLKRVDRA